MFQRKNSQVCIHQSGTPDVRSCNDVTKDLEVIFRGFHYYDDLSFENA